MFPTNLSATYTRNRQHVCPVGWAEMNQYPHVATASTRSLSSSGVHGVNLGWVMIGRRDGEGGDEEEIGCKGREKSMAIQASFKGPGTGHPLTSKTLIQKRCLFPWVFVFPNRGGGDGLTKSNEEKKIPTGKFLPNSNKPRIEPRVSRGEGSASVVRSFALQQSPCFSQP